MTDDYASLRPINPGERVADHEARAALAPVNPSSADRAVAAQAAQTAVQARAELSRRDSVDVSDAEGTKGAVVDVYL